MSEQLENHPEASSSAAAEAVNEQPDHNKNINEPVQQPSIRQMIIGGIGFILFLTVLTLAINAIGVENLQQFIRDAGPLAPLIYIGIKATTYVFAPLTSGPIQVVAGTMFDSIWLGVLYTLIGEVIGGSISFWIADRFGRPVVKRLVGEDNMNQVDDFYQNKLGGWRSLAVARIVLFSVWDFLSYAAGLASAITFRSYFLVSLILGAFPTFFFVWLGNRAVLDTSSLLLIYGLVALLIILPILFRKQITSLLQFTGDKQQPKMQNNPNQSSDDESSG